MHRAYFCEAVLAIPAVLGAVQSWVKIEENFLRRGDVKKKRHGHNFEFWAPKLNQRGTNMVVSTLIQFRAVIFKIVAVSFFLDTS